MYKLTGLGPLVATIGAAVLMASNFAHAQVDGAVQYPPASVGKDAQPDWPHSVRKDRDPLEVRQKPALRLDIGMADVVSDLNALAGDHTFSRHAAPRTNTH